MSTLLKKLYNGEIFPAEQYDHFVEEYRIIRKNQMDNYDNFIKKLGNPLDIEFIKIMDEQLDTLPLDFFQMFSDGFRLGAKMMIEILEDENPKETNG